MKSIEPDACASRYLCELKVRRSRNSVSEVAIFQGRIRVLLCLFVLAELVKMSRVVVMVSGGVVVSGRLIVMLSRSCFCDFGISGTPPENEQVRK